LPRARSPNRDKAFEIFKEFKGNIENRRIAEMLGISEKTVGGWKCKDKWDESTNGVLHKKKRSTPNKKGGQPGNKNATGPPKNKNAEKHGLFSKWLPEETMEIIGCIEHSNPIDLLWDNIQLQYAAIIRAQNLMYVRDQDDMTKEISCDGLATSYDIQYAWDKHSNFMQAQSRAMKTLESMIKQYDGLTRSDLVTEEQRARIDKLKADVAKINGEEESFEDDGFLDALSGKVKEIWEDE